MFHKHILFGLMCYAMVIDSELIFGLLVVNHEHILFHASLGLCVLLLPLSNFSKVFILKNAEW